MTTPADIPDHIREWAADFWDANLETEQVEMVARAYMAGQGAGPDASQEAAVGLTKTQAKVYGFTRTYIDAHAFSPTYDEIAAGCGLRNKGRVCALVDQLVGRGLIRRLPNRARSISIVNIRDVSTVHTMSGAN